MKFRYCIFIVCTIFSLSEIAGYNFQSTILDYFKSDTVSSFQKQWQKYKAPMENIVLLALKEIYGHKGMNVYVRKMRDPHKINMGYYHTDNQVQIILSDLELDNLPHVWMPQVTFPLPSNVLRVDASLSRMIVRCNYMAFRNHSSIIYDLKDQNDYKHSPFSFQQTKTIGKLGIIMEGCILSGFTVATLNGPSVNLGHDTFYIHNCHYTFEIYSPGTQAPPVFASYYPEGQGLNIEELLMVSLCDELMPKLQSAMFSYVNTTAIFGKNLPDILDKQQAMFRYTTSLMNDVTRNMNKITIEKNIATVTIDNFKITWDDLFTWLFRCPIEIVANMIASAVKYLAVVTVLILYLYILPECLLQEVKLNRMVLTGLDTAYSSHTGGPVSLPVTYIAEEIRFERLQVYGVVEYKGGKHVSHNFSAEIKDTAVSVLMEIKMLRNAKRKNDNVSMKSVKTFKVTGWRSFEFSASGDETISIKTLVNGYLLKVLPDLIVSHLNQVYYEAVEKVHSEKSGLNPNYENQSGTLVKENKDTGDLQDVDESQNENDLEDTQKIENEENQEDKQQEINNKKQSEDILEPKNEEPKETQETNNEEKLEITHKTKTEDELKDIPDLDNEANSDQSKNKHEIVQNKTFNSNGENEPMEYGKESTIDADNSSIAKTEESLEDKKNDTFVIIEEYNIPSGKDNFGDKTKANTETTLDNQYEDIDEVEKSDASDDRNSQSELKSTSTDSALIYYKNSPRFNVSSTHQFDNEIRSDY